MCRGVRFRIEEKDHEVMFASGSARLPILQKSGDVRLLPWGRRPREKGKLPVGGWARRADILNNEWDAYQPKSVKIPVTAFMETDVVGNRHWFEVTKGKYIQGLIATGEDKEERLYVVTIRPPPEEAEYEQWPKVVAVA